MKKVLIWGTTMFSKEMMNYVKINSENWDCIGFTLDKDYIDTTTFCEYPVFAFEELSSNFNMDDIEIIPSIGYHNINQNRLRLFKKCKQKNYKIANFIDKSVVNYSKSIGYGNIILDYVQLNFDSVIGNGNIIKGNTTIAHDTIVGEFNYFAGTNHVGGDCKIGNYNFFGISSIIKSSSTIGNSNLIGAATYVDINLEDYSIISPAKNRTLKSNERSIKLLLNT